MRRVLPVLAALLLAPAALADEPQSRGAVGIQVSQGNSHYQPLGANASFTGNTEDVLHYQEADINVMGAPANAPGTLFFEFSPDGTHWDVSISLPVNSPSLLPIPLRIVLPFFRIRYVNGAVAQTSLRITTVYHNVSAARLTRFPFQVIDPNEPTQVVHGLVAGERQDGTYANAVLDTANRFQVSVANQPATQPVSGTVAVSNFPATQPVSGTVAVSGVAGTVTVAGTVAATQSGAWAVAAVQSGAWAVVVSGSVAVTNSNLDTPLSTLASLANQTNGSQKTQVTNFPASQTVNGTVTANQGVPNTIPNSWPMFLTTSGSTTLGTQAHPLRADPTGTTTQPVSGTVSVGNTPTVTSNAGSGTFAVSAASLPLPAGAATAANQTNGSQVTQVSTLPAGTVAGASSLPAGSNTIGSVKVTDGTHTAAVTAGSALQTDGSAVTQPVSGTVAVSSIASAVAVSSVSGTVTVAGTVAATQSGTWTVQQGGAPWSVSVSNFPATQAVSAASLPLPSNAAQETGGNLAAVAANQTNGTEKVQVTSLPSQAAFIADGSNAALRATVTPFHALKVDPSGVITNVRGTVKEQRDTGRVYVSFTATGIAGVAADTLMAMTVTRQGVQAAATATGYTVPSGRVLRCQNMTLCARTGAAAANWSRWELRNDPTGAGAVTAPIVAPLDAEPVAATSGLGAACANTWWPEGIEFAGDGKNMLVFTHNGAAATNVETGSIQCYEYTPLP